MLSLCHNFLSEIIIDSKIIFSYKYLLIIVIIQQKLAYQDTMFEILAQRDCTKPWVLEQLFAYV